MRTDESSKGRFVKEIRSIRSFLPIIRQGHEARGPQQQAFDPTTCSRPASIIFQIRGGGETSSSPHQYSGGIGHGMSETTKFPFTAAREICIRSLRCTECI
jgi:hypothetical protein